MLLQRCHVVHVGDSLWVRHVYVSEYTKSLFGRDIACSYEEKWTQVVVRRVEESMVHVSGSGKKDPMYVIQVKELYKNVSHEDTHSDIMTIQNSSDTSYVPSVGTFNSEGMQSYLPSSVTSSPSKETTNPYMLSSAGVSEKFSVGVIENKTWFNCVSKYVMGIHCLLSWLKEHVYKLHASWKPLIWSYDTAKYFPERFKRMVRMFVLDSSEDKHTKVRAMRLVWEHMSKQMYVYRKN